jgi:hypothetical protein
LSVEGNGHQFSEKKMSRRTYYEQRCFDLAELYLSDEPLLDYEEGIRRLALHIKEAAEDKIASMRREEEEFIRMTRQNATAAAR